MPETKQPLSTQPYRGTRDFFPPDMRKLNYIFSVWRKVAQNYGYEEYLSPLLEPWELYATKNISGEEIVNEQLYWFEDKGGRKVAIRPEMTPSVARMIATKVSQLPKPIRWFSIANFMRFERPQHGRAREFFQLNIDIFGLRSNQADAELIETAIMIMREFRASEKMFEIRVSNRNWINFWMEKYLEYKGNTLSLSRIIDRLNKQDAQETEKQLVDIKLTPGQIEKVLALGKVKLEEISNDQNNNEGAKDLIDLFEVLEQRGLVGYVKFDASLIRGFDYYTGNVFEQFDLNPNNKRSMFGGGRYDKLVDLFGAEPISANGYAPGDITTTYFLENWGLMPGFGTGVQVLVTVFNENLRENAWRVASQLREAGIKTELYLKKDESITEQLNYANRKKIPNAIILGQDEVSKSQVKLKNMQASNEVFLSISELIDSLTR